MSRTTGFNAHIRFLKVAYMSVTDSPRVVETKEFKKILDRITIQDYELTKDTYVPGSSGQGKLYWDLKKQGLKG